MTVSKDVLQRGTLNPLSGSVIVNPLYGTAGTELPLRHKLKLKSNPGQLESRHHSRENSLAKLKEITLITMESHAHFASTTSVESEGTKAHEAGIFSHVSDYSNDPNAYRDAQTGQWYVHNPATNTCKWIVEETNAESVHMHYNQLKNNLPKGFGLSSTLQRVQSLCRLREEDAGPTHGKVEHFSWTDETNDSRYSENPDAHFDPLSGCWYTYDSATGESKWIAE